ncbi:MAG: hypothetical protein C4547_12710 [Phycisphaerales bacterium]|nr:MAG: hypothetical protein C4547_12710 [Phycisphaerales bacterium]
MEQVRQILTLQRVCSTRASALIVLCAAAAVMAQPRTRVSDSEYVVGPQTYDRVTYPAPQPPTATEVQAIDITFAHAPMARNGQAVPGGGTLNAAAWGNPATVNASGRIAFFAQISGDQRNQGMFTADERGLHVIARGCGGLGGSGNPGSCGDPTPVGGTFSGMFFGTFFVPSINDAGDVLFISDVFNGPTSRGLFLYRSGEADIIKIAAVGDPSPMGGSIGMVGPGSINNRRQIVFLAFNEGSLDGQIFRWESGVVTRHVVVGDPVPGGGTFSILAGERVQFQDGTWVPTGVVPDINDQGDVSFFSVTQGAEADRGLFVTRDGRHEWYVRSTEQTPLGGRYLNLFAPILNNNGEIAFYCDIQIGQGQFNSAWIVGRPGAYQKRLAFFDVFDDGRVWVQALGRNPMNALDDCGNFTAWCKLQMRDLSEVDRMLVFGPDGARHVVARYNDPTPLGGRFTAMQGWPSMNDFGDLTLGANTPGATAANVQFLSGIGNARGDGDDNGAIDLFDYSGMADCLAGPESCPATYECKVFDFDGDGDVDMADAGGFQRAFTGE